MRLRYTQPALADLDAILAYIAEHSPQGAAHVHARIQLVIDLLLSHPNIGVQTEDPTIRRAMTALSLFDLL
jgi:plasmid stabilization system protein ParE